MKKTDIGVVVFMYLVCGYFYYHMTKLKASSQTYPRFTILLLFGLTTLYLVQMVIAARKYGVESGVNEVFKDFQAAQFFVCLIASILYLVCIYFFGFYISTVLYIDLLSSQPLTPYIVLPRPLLTHTLRRRCVVKGRQPKQNVARSCKMT